MSCDISCLLIALFVHELLKIDWRLPVESLWAIEPIRYPQHPPTIQAQTVGWLGRLEGGNLDVSIDHVMRCPKYVPFGSLRYLGAIQHGYLLPGKNHERNENFKRPNRRA